MTDPQQLLPSNLKSSTHRDVPATVQDRLHYLWTLISSTSMAAKLASSADSSENNSTAADNVTCNPNGLLLGHLGVLHRLSRDFMGLVKEHAIELPSAIQERHCRSCCVVLVPALTSSVRLRKRTRRSRANRISNHPNCMETELIERCLMCDTVRKAAALYRNKPEPISGSTPKAGTASVPKANSGTAIGSAQKAQKQPQQHFSFLHHRGSIDSQTRRSSAPGRIGQQDFLSFGSTTSLGRFGSIFSPIINKSKTSSSSSSRLPPPPSETGSSQARPPSSEFNLLELERTNKKQQQQKRRRTLGPTTSEK